MASETARAPTATWQSGLLPNLSRCIVLATFPATQALCRDQQPRPEERHRAGLRHGLAAGATAAGCRRGRGAGGRHGSEYRGAALDLEVVVAQSRERRAVPLCAVLLEGTPVDYARAVVDRHSSLVCAKQNAMDDVWRRMEIDVARDGVVLDVVENTEIAHGRDQDVGVLHADVATDVDDQIGVSGSVDGQCGTAQRQIGDIEDVLS